MKKLIAIGVGVILAGSFCFGSISAAAAEESTEESVDSVIEVAPYSGYVRNDSAGELYVTTHDDRGVRVIVTKQSQENPAAICYDAVLESAGTYRFILDSCEAEEGYFDADGNWHSNFNTTVDTDTEDSTVESGDDTDTEESTVESGDDTDTEESTVESGDDTDTEESTVESGDDTDTEESTVESGDDTDTEESTVESGDDTDAEESTVESDAENIVSVEGTASILEAASVGETVIEYFSSYTVTVQDINDAKCSYTQDGILVYDTGFSQDFSLTTLTWDVTSIESEARNVTAETMDGLKVKDVWMYTADITLEYMNYLMGDVNADGAIDPSDSYLVLVYYANNSLGLNWQFTNEVTEQSEEYAFAAADTNLDNEIDPKDATLILKYYSNTMLGLEAIWELL